MMGMRSEAIRIHCMECEGCPKLVTLCYRFDCEFWPFRCGYSTNDKRYKQRIAKAKIRFAKDFAEMERMGVDTTRFLPEEGTK